MTTCEVGNPRRGLPWPSVVVLATAFVVMVVFSAYWLSLMLMPRLVAQYTPFFSHAMRAMSRLHSHSYESSMLSRFRDENKKYNDWLAPYLISSDLNERLVAELELLVWTGDMNEPAHPHLGSPPMP